jgi:hypothetical protein
VVANRGFATMALRTLVEVPLGLRNTFTVVPPVRRIALGPFWDDSWANWAKKNPRVPDISGGLSFENCRDFTKAKLTEIKALASAEIAVQQLVCEIGAYFTKLEPVEVHLAELSKQLHLQVAGEGGFKPGFDSVAHFAEMQRLATTKTEYVTRVWQLYFIAAELDTDSSVGRTEDRVDMLEAEVAVLNQRLAGGHPTSGPSVDVLNSEFNAKRTTEPARGPFRRPPAPLFNGEKEGTDIITWLGQFDDYSCILGLRDDELVSHASLCLTGRAAKEWALLKRSLSVQGKDVKDFAVFKTSLLAHFVEVEVENTVRPRLARLRQTKSVAAYHATFRAIMVEAVKYPISGPEACAYFRAGLKPNILEVLTRDSLVRNELGNLDMVVQAAKEAESFLRMLPGAANEKETQELKALLKGKRQADGDAIPPPKRAAVGKPSGSLSGSGAGPSGTQPNAYVAKMKREGRCYKCGELGHTAKFCKKPDAHDKGKGKAPAS